MKLVILSAAAEDMERLHHFLLRDAGNPFAAEHAALSFKASLDMLSEHPYLGRPMPHDPAVRNLTVPFGKGGYPVHH